MRAVTGKVRSEAGRVSNPESATLLKLPHRRKRTFAPRLLANDYPAGMPLQLYIPPCLRDPAHHLHLPELGQPLRIQIEGPVVAIERLFPTITWHTNPTRLEFPQPAAQELANLAYRTIYGKEPRLGDAVVKDEYLGWVVENPMT